MTSLERRTLNASAASSKGYLQNGTFREVQEGTTTLGRQLSIKEEEWYIIPATSG
jgi:hypothetical protein